MTVTILRPSLPPLLKCLRCGLVRTFESNVIGQCWPWSRLPMSQRSVFCLEHKHCPASGDAR